MADSQSPFFLADRVMARLRGLVRAPDWLVREVQQRLVLMLNHVLQQEPEAQERIRRHKGSVVLTKWRDFEIHLVATPAGLLDLADTGARPDLVLTLTQSSPLDLARATARGDKPAVRIQGDVQLAAEINWLVDHVRWDIEEDLSRVIGDAPAHAICDAARRIAQGLRGFVGARGDGGKPEPTAAGGSSSSKEKTEQQAPPPG